MPRSSLQKLHSAVRRWPVRATCAAAVLVVILLVSLVPLALADTVSFPDVSASHPYHAAIIDLASRGIIAGYENGTFGPTNDVQRQQFAKMAVLTGGYQVSEANVCTFVDVPTGGPTTLYPDNYIAVCAAAGITTGKTPTTFDPYGNITRYQAISMVVRMADNLHPGLLTVPPAGYSGTAAWGTNPTHGANAIRAEYNGLLAGLQLDTLNPGGNMTRGECAQVLHNLLVKMGLTPDYANSANWLAIPQTTTKKVDVFYLSDTTYAKATPNSPDIGPIDDPKMQQGAKAKFTTTAAVFETIGNVYAPYNRQVDAQYKSTLPIAQQLSLEAGTPTSDAVSAFDYYIKNMNDGRPFILAGHSQGSNLIANILSGYMTQHPDVYKRMIAAYVIGFSITGDYLTQNPHLKFATGPDDTGVIISYNTEAAVMKVTNPVTMPGGIAINPITWTTSETLASVAQNLGGIQVDPQTGEAVVDASGDPVKVEHYADAQVNKQRGVVICSTADPNQLAPGSAAEAAGIYHPYDYAFYFFDIRANAENRVAHYLNSGSAATVTPTDYSQPAHWLAVPSSPDKQVDVFYIYPTAYSKAAPSDPNFCAVDNPQMMKGAQTAFQRQAMAFEPSANLYAPYYRQVDAMYQLALPAAQQDENIQREPLVDVTAAFEYYLHNYNQGRPFILAAHSQGSAVLRDLLSGYMKTHPDVYKRMIVAYVVGQSITPEYLAANPHLKYATGPDDTGVIVSWNTEAPVVDGTNPVTLPGGIAINPITWTTGEATATAAQNLGSVQLNPQTGMPELDSDGQIKRVTGVADARVDQKRGVVICSTVDPAKYASGFPKGVYHTFDYPFYFFDIRANAANRIEHYLADNR